jgi:subtilisin family serine protease
VKKPLVLSLAVLGAACADPSAPPPAAEAPLLAVGQSDVIPGRFIVTLRDGSDPAAVAADHGVAPSFVYRNAIRGFAGGMSDAARSGLLRDARVARVEPDQRVSVSTIQSNATWGLDRIDARAGLSGTFSYTNTGAGVTAYIIDTGIDGGHAEFTGRIAAATFDAFTDGQSDCNGHGTHVAGTVGGTRYGVAKAVTLVRVRVLDCAGSGSWSGVIAGMDWVVAHHGTGPAVANMSLGGGASTAVDDATRRMIADGVATAVAAGNGNRGGRAQDACGYSPARVAEAMTIGATTQSDAKTSWSNYGACVDWFAPGSGITSAWIGSGSTETNTISGTSMATPHVAGVAALYLQGNTGATPQQVRDALYAATTKGVVTSSSTANNHLLFTAY